MKTKILSFILLICLFVPCLFLAGCNPKDDEDDYKNLPSIEVISDNQFEEIFDDNFKIAYKEIIKGEINKEVVVTKYGTTLKELTDNKSSEIQIYLVYDEKLYEHCPEMSDGNGGTIPENYKLHSGSKTIDSILNNIKTALKPYGELKYEEVKNITFLDRACKEYKVRDISGHLNTYIIDNESGLVLKRISDTYTLEITEITFEPESLQEDINKILVEDPQ